MWCSGCAVDGVECGEGGYVQTQGSCIEVGLQVLDIGGAGDEQDVRRVLQ